MDVSLLYVFLCGKLDRWEAYYHDATDREKIQRKTLLECIISPDILIQVTEYIKATPEQLNEMYSNGEVPEEDMYLIALVCYICNFTSMNPSGQPITTELNCDVNEDVTMYALCDVLLEEQGGAANYTEETHIDVQCIVDETQLLLFGDDNTMSVSDDIKEIVTPIKLVHAFKRIGLTFTASDKSELGNEWKSSKDTTFLKRAFKETRVGYDGPLAMETVTEMTQWEKENEPFGVREDVVDGCLRELAGHGSEEWDLIANKIISSSITNIGYTPKYRTFHEAYLAFKGIKACYGMQVNTDSPIYDDEVLVDTSVFLLDKLEAGETDNTVTTEFVEESIEKSVVYTSKPVDLRVNETKHDSTEFFGKMYLVDSGTWLSTYPVGYTMNTQFNIIQKLLTLPIFSNKADGMNGIRGNAVIRIVVNFNQFQQAGGLLHVLPLADSIGAVDPSYIPMHNADICTMMQQPSVQFTAKDGTIIMKIPFITPAPWYSKTTGLYDIGRVYLTVLSKLRTGTTTDKVSWSMYLGLEDVEFVVPMVPQAGKLSVTDLESRSVVSKPVSNILFAGSKLASALSVIPTIAPLCTTTSWALATMAATASSLGYSKPINDSNSVYMVPLTNRYSATGEGMDNVMPLGVSCNNQTRLTDKLTPYACDEMSFRFLLQVEAAIATEVPFLGTAVPGDNLGIVAPSDVRLISPRGLYCTGTRSVSTHTATFGMGPPIWYFSDQFTLWRGSVILRFQFFKSNQSCRLQFTWTPSPTAITGPTLNTSAYSIREIFDLSEADSFEVTLPWMVQQNYLPVNTPSGKWNLLVLNAIVAPSVVSPDIYFNIYARGGPDFEFAMPSKGVNLPFSPQAGEVVSVNPGLIANEGLTMVDTNSAQESTGEYITSIRQILNRYQYVPRSAALVTGLTRSIWPWASGVCYLDSATGVFNAPLVGGDFYSLVSQLYCMYKGAMHLQIPFDNQGYGFVEPIATGAVVQTRVTPTLNSPYAWASNTNYSAIGFTNGSDGASVPVHVPYYASFKASLRLNQTISDVIPSEQSQPFSVYSRTTLSTTTFTSPIFRRIGEDFQLMYFVGTVPKLLTYA